MRSSDISNREKGLRGIGLVNQQKLFAFDRGRRGERSGGGSLGGPAAEGLLEFSAHLRGIEFPGYGQYRVPGRVVGFVKLHDGVALDARERNLVAAFRSRVRMLAEKIAIEVGESDGLSFVF